jgi:hypothetical protein
VLFIGTQFSNLYTAVDTSAAAACNALCVCVLFFFSLFFWRTCILRMSPHLSFPAPRLSHFALHHPDFGTCSTYFYYCVSKRDLGTLSFLLSNILG